MALARAANVKKLILFHHDPTRADDDLAAIEREVQFHFPNAVAAREGMVLEL